MDAADTRRNHHIEDLATVAPATPRAKDRVLRMAVMAAATEKKVTARKSMMKRKKKRSSGRPKELRSGDGKKNGDVGELVSRPADQGKRSRPTMATTGIGRIVRDGIATIATRDQMPSTIGKGTHGTERYTRSSSSHIRA